VVSWLTARLYEGRVGAVFGMIMLGLGFGGAFGAWASGWLFDVTGGYETGFALAAISCLFGIAIFWMIPEFARAQSA